MASSASPPTNEPITFSDLPQEIKDAIYAASLSLPYTNQCPALIWTLKGTDQYAEAVLTMGKVHTVVLDASNNYSAGTMSQQHLDIIDNVTVQYTNEPDEGNNCRYRYRYFVDTDHRINNPKGCRNDIIRDQLTWFPNLKTLTIDVHTPAETNEWFSMIKLYMRTTRDEIARPSLRTIRLLIRRGVAAPRDISSAPHNSGASSAVGNTNGPFVVPVANMYPHASRAVPGACTASISLLSRFCGVNGVLVSTGLRGEGEEEWVWKLQEGWWMMIRPWGVF